MFLGHNLKIPIRPSTAGSSCSLYFDSIFSPLHFRLATGEEELDAGVDEDALHHGEALLVLSSGDLEDVALELVAESVSLDLLGHALVEEDAAAQGEGCVSFV